MAVTRRARSYRLACGRFAAIALDGVIYGLGAHARHIEGMIRNEEIK
jgi:hypothetical protein